MQNVLMDFCCAPPRLQVSIKFKAVSEPQPNGKVDVLHQFVLPRCVAVMNMREQAVFVICRWMCSSRSTVSHASSRWRCPPRQWRPAAVCVAEMCCSDEYAGTGSICHL
jgi:hypothetical protein